MSAWRTDDAVLVRDLTDPEQGHHALQRVVDDLTAALTNSWSAAGCELRLIRRHPMVTIAENYERLGYPVSAVTRDARYTRYVDATHVLRSSSTAMIPSALTDLSDAPVDDVLLAAAGICYRRDSVDWQHTGTPHQMDLWRMSSVRRLDVRDLVNMIGVAVASVLPGRRWRTVPATHPYTTHGRQIDVRHDGQWIEIGECGLAGPDVLTRAGLDTSRWSGLAMGLGLDRILMLAKGIPDVRLLRSDDPRVRAQMLDLEPYQPVSHMPAIRRDISIAIADTTDASAEALGDRVRSALGVDADVAESVDVVSETSYEALPLAARARLGMHPRQRNLLVRLMLRSFDRTLTDPEANELRDRAYAALHEGGTQQWSTSIGVGKDPEA